LGREAAGRGLRKVSMAPCLLEEESSEVVVLLEGLRVSRYSLKVNGTGPRVLPRGREGGLGEANKLGARFMG
jgi:hypothetical protein